MRYNICTKTLGGGISEGFLFHFCKHSKKKTADFSTVSKLGADDEARTRYLHLGKVALYQMSYIRIFCFSLSSVP